MARNPPTSDSHPQAAVEEGTPPCVMVVDDEYTMRNLMTRWLRASGYPVQSAGSAEEALELQRHAPAAVALCDIRLPHHDGVWLSEQLRRFHPETAVIMTTGAPDMETALATLRNGVVDYLPKPFQRDQVCAAVGRGVARYRDALEASRPPSPAQPAIQQFDQGGLQMQSAAALDGILATLALRDPAAFDHAHRVTELSIDLASALRVREPELSLIQQAALLHEIGKLSLPDSILRNAGPLTREEMDEARRFPEVGHDLITGLWPFLQGTAEVVRSVHEWYDGSGFPRGLSAERIVRGARIIAAADAYDAMTHPRVFRAAVSPAEAVFKLGCRAGTQFDPRVVDRVPSVLGMPGS